MSYELNLPKFSGPIEALLDLIERKRLDITELSLAEVTADFLKYLDQIEEVEPRLLADFVVVASRLILIKSRALLPNLELTAEEERDIKELEAQLYFYRNFKPAVSQIKNLWETNGFSVSRPLMAGRLAVFYPALNINLQNIVQSMRSIFETLAGAYLEIKTVRTALFTIEEKIQDIVNSLNKSSTGLKFKEINKNKTRSEIIVMFLALLQLINSHLIKAQQRKHFSDIMIEKQ